ncbi:DUF721 domain-containing protein [Micavibrio aeruginosavorus]|uniref:DUF721 domain-containing protein n=1 Tax=Micavibrio aeruginosavorus TaxID=349221 RepID=UPI0009DA6FD4|nr:DUF721 domain-containing protein [Micavibrio aeruginosavorus]
MSLRQLSEAIPKVTGKIFSRKYIMLGRLVTHWADIVGADVADRCHPAELRFRKVPNQKHAEVSLDIAAGSADATLLHYRKDLILERINQIFGEQMVAAIRFVPLVVSEQDRKKRAAALRPRKPLSATQHLELNQLLEKVEDPDIKERLARLGTSILQDRQT